MEKSLSTILQQNSDSLNYLLPEIILVITFLGTIIVDLFWKKKEITLFVTFFGLSVALLASVAQLGVADKVLFNGMLQFTGVAVMYKLVCSAAALVALVILLSEKSLLNTAKGIGEYCTLLVGLTIGCHIMCLATNLLSIFVAVEMVSLAAYLLVAYQSADRKASEGAVKYVLFGAVASAILLYGISLVYGLTGTLQLIDSNFLANLSKAPLGLVAISLVFILGGIVFKLSVVPFHFWTPDVYQSSPISVVVLVSSVPKIAAFALLSSFLGVFSFQLNSGPLIWPHFPWQNVLAVLAMLTLTVGNLSAMGQQNVKRLLAWSSIAHTGFMLLALVAFSVSGHIALLFYLLVYVVMNGAAFFAVLLLEKNYNATTIHDYTGLGAKAPLVAVLLVICLVSLIGLPATAGFVAKFLVFSTVLDAYAINANPILLVALVLGAINTVISLFYYFKIVVFLFLKKQVVALQEVGSVYLWEKGVLIFLVLLILVLGLFPSTLIAFISSIVDAKSAMILY